MEAAILLMAVVVSIVPALLAAGIVAYALRNRMHAMTATIESLDRRLRALEGGSRAARRTDADNVGPVATPPIQPATFETPPFLPAQLSTESRDALETRIGTRWLLYVGV